MRFTRLMLLFCLLSTMLLPTAHAMFWYESEPIQYTQGDGITKFTGHYLKNPYYSDYWTEDGYAMILLAFGQGLMAEAAPQVTR